MKGGQNQFHFTRFIEELISVALKVADCNQEDIIIFLDNASCHVSGYTMNNLRSQKITLFCNAAYSPGLNVIEPVFGDLKFHLRK